MSNFKDVQSHTEFSAEKMQKVNLFETRNFFCDIYCFEPGQEQKPHTHKAEDKIYFVLEGSGTIQIDKEEHFVEKNQICLAAAGLEHGVKNTGGGRMKLLVFMTPNPNKVK